MDFHQLQYFNTIASLENMSKAAELLHISQGALSKTISKLEEEVGYPLFDRYGKKLSLNAAGSTFLVYSTEAINLLDKGVKSGATESKLPKNLLKIGIIGDNYKLIKCAADYAMSHPDICLDISNLLEGSENPNINDYDLILCPDTGRYKEFTGYCLYEDKQFLVVNRNHPLANKIALKITDLNDLNLVFKKQGNSIENAFWRISALYIKPHGCFYVSSREVQKQLIQENLVCGFASDGSFKYYKDADNIKLIPISDKRFSINMKIAFKREKHLSNEAKDFKKYVMEYFNIGSDNDNTQI